MRRHVCALGVGVLLLVGCTDDGTGDSADATSPPSAPQGTVSGDGQLPHGAAVYAASCASCHGADLRGTEEGPSHLSIVYEPNHHSDESFRRAIANGAPAHHFDFGDMPPVPGLTDEDVEAVIAFVRAEQTRQGFHS